jgi:hypothetical protein
VEAKLRDLKMTYAFLKDMMQGVSLYLGSTKQRLLKVLHKVNPLRQIVLSKVVGNKIFLTLSNLYFFNCSRGYRQDLLKMETCIVVFHFGDFSAKIYLNISKCISLGVNVYSKNYVLKYFLFKNILK